MKAKKVLQRVQGVVEHRTQAENDRERALRSIKAAREEKQAAHLGLGALFSGPELEKRRMETLKNLNMLFAQEVEHLAFLHTAYQRKLERAQAVLAEAT